MSRSLFTLFLFLSAIAARGQSADDLAKRYGKPDGQRFLIRPGVSLMARYAADRTACEIVIEPIRSIIPRAEPDKYIRPEVMDQIIGEVLPEAVRGKLLFGAVIEDGCNDLELKDYENVTIQRFRSRCGLPNAETEETARITRKNPSCSAITTVPTTITPETTPKGPTPETMPGGDKGCKVPRTDIDPKVCHQG